jgi:hypothetical protein
VTVFWEVAWQINLAASLANQPGKNSFMVLEMSNCYLANQPGKPTWRTRTRTRARVTLKISGNSQAAKQLPGHPDTRTPGHPDTRTPGHPDTRNCCNALQRAQQSREGTDLGDSQKTQQRRTLQVTDTKKAGVLPALLVLRLVIGDARQKRPPEQTICRGW